MKSRRSCHKPSSSASDGSDIYAGGRWDLDTCAWVIHRLTIAAGLSRASSEGRTFARSVGYLSLAAANLINFTMEILCYCNLPLQMD